MFLSTQVHSSQDIFYRTIGDRSVKPGLSPASSLPNDTFDFSPAAVIWMMASFVRDLIGEPANAVALPLSPSFGPTATSSEVPAPVSRPNCVSKPVPVSKPAKPGCTGLRTLVQSNRVSCGQASVAMAVNWLTGGKLTDRDVNRKYGFSLLTALNAESRSAGVRWKDAGNFTKSHWTLLEKKLNTEKLPVLIGLNGPQFSASGLGHIVTLLSIDRDQVRYADPADGTIKTASKKSIEMAPAHPDGKFVFYASRV